MCVNGCVMINWSCIVGWLGIDKVIFELCEIDVVFGGDGMGVLIMSDGI